MRLHTFALVSATMMSSIAAADVIHVPADEPTIQAAITAAVNGDEILVAPGTYNEVIDLMGKAIAVRAENASAELADPLDPLDASIIDATGLDASVVTCDDGEGLDTVLDGFTITGGSGTCCREVGSEQYTTGGGLNSLNSSPTVIECVFLMNSADIGGGMHNGDYSSSKVVGCTFSANSALWGAGMQNYQSDPTVIGCAFVDNTSENAGGGMHNQESNPTLVNCTFKGNRYLIASGGGGGMLNIFGSNITMTGALFVENEGAGGAAILNYSDSNLMISNATIMENVATTNVGGGIYNAVNSHATAVNCVIWGNVGGQIVGFDTSTTTASYCNIQGGYDGVGNINADPLCVDPAGGDFRVGAGSPCIDAGHNWGVPQDTVDLDSDGNTSELIPFDLDGNPRFNADELDFDAGCGVPVVVDMGAHEYQFDPVEEVLFADTDGNQAVDADDLIGLILDWGPCDEECCLSDFDLNGQVDVDDLLALILNWG